MGLIQSVEGLNRTKTDPLPHPCCLEQEGFPPADCLWTHPQLFVGLRPASLLAEFGFASAHDLVSQFGAVNLSVPLSLPVCLLLVLFVWRAPRSHVPRPSHVLSLMAALCKGCCAPVLQMRTVQKGEGTCQERGVTGTETRVCLIAKAVPFPPPSCAHGADCLAETRLAAG